MRTSVMTHMAWVPHGWRERGARALDGMAERHPSRTIAALPGAERRRPDRRARGGRACELAGRRPARLTEVVELHAARRRARRRRRASSQPLLISDLPVFFRWRGEPPWARRSSSSWSTSPTG